MTKGRRKSGGKEGSDRKKEWKKWKEGIGSDGIEEGREGKYKGREKREGKYKAFFLPIASLSQSNLKEKIINKHQ